MIDWGRTLYSLILFKLCRLKSNSLTFHIFSSPFFVNNHFPVNFFSRRESSQIVFQLDTNKTHSFLLFLFVLFTHEFLCNFMQKRLEIPERNGGIRDFISTSCTYEKYKNENGHVCVSWSTLPNKLLPYFLLFALSMQYTFNSFIGQRICNMRGPKDWLMNGRK